jgi:DNA polymerase III sliding clamp (beta) subunit (PCNA family)
MRCRIERDALRDALALVIPAATHKGMPILSCVRIDVTRKAVTLTASDLDLTIAAQLPVGDAEPGTAIVPCKLVAAAVAKMGEGAVELSTDDGALTIDGWPGSLTLRLADVDAWPNLPTEADGTEVTIEPGDVELLGKVARFCSTDPARPGLRGVIFGDGKAVGSDSYRMAVAELGAEVPECKVPTEALLPALKAAGDGELLPERDMFRLWAELERLEVEDVATAAPTAVVTPRPSSQPVVTVQPVVTYANCAAVRAAGKAPLRRGDPGYSSALDRDGDGIACE